MNKPKIKAKHLGIITAIHERQPDKALLLLAKDNQVHSVICGIDNVQDLLSIVGVSLYSIYANSISAEQRKNYDHTKFLMDLNTSFLRELKRDASHESKTSSDST